MVRLIESTKDLIYCDAIVLVPPHTWTVDISSHLNSPQHMDDKLIRQERSTVSHGGEELKRKFPLKLPWFTDPRKMRRHEMCLAIKSYGGDTATLPSMSKAELVATVYDLLLESGKRCPLDPMNMDDEQPEKWYLLAEQLHQQLREETPDAETRRLAMIEANNALGKLTFEELIQIGNGSAGRCETALRFASALMLEPHFEQAAEARTGRRGLIRASVTIAGNYNGHTGLPKHLTIDAARQQNYNAHQQRANRKRSAAHNFTETEICLGKEVGVALGSDRRVRARAE